MERDTLTTAAQRLERMLDAVRAASREDASAEDIYANLRTVLNEMTPLHAEVLGAWEHASMTRLDNLATDDQRPDHTPPTH